MKWLLLIMLLGCFSCSTLQYNPDQTRVLEWQFVEQAAVRTAATLESYVQESCKCQGGKFATEKCRLDANTALTVKYRTPWHVAMAMYRVGLLEKRPPETPPSVPAAETLCPKVNP